MKIKDLGYAAVGATLSAIYPSFIRRLKHEAMLARLQRNEAARQRTRQNNITKGIILENANYVTKKVRERCNHKKGGSLGTLVVKAWHHNGYSSGDNFVMTPDGPKFIPVPPGKGNGISRWEGEWVGHNSVIAGTGDSNQYAVTKHVFANGDMHIRCMRCGKNWKPGDEGYAEAQAFPTLNAISTSAQFGARETGTWGVVARNPDLKEEKEFQERYKAALGNRS